MSGSWSQGRCLSESKLPLPQTDPRHCCAEHRGRSVTVSLLSFLVLWDSSRQPGTLHPGWKAASLMAGLQVQDRSFAFCTLVISTVYPQIGWSLQAGRHPPPTPPLAAVRSFKQCVRCRCKVWLWIIGNLNCHSCCWFVSHFRHPQPGCLKLSFSTTCIKCQKMA